MKVSLSWLRQYITIDVEVAKLAEALTMAGLEVDALSERYAYLDSIRVGRIERIEPHPASEDLYVCQVDAGTGALTIVCGAKNIRVGHLVPVALPGAQLPSGERIGSGRVHGQPSEGMLCSEAELFLGQNGSGILILPEGSAPGGDVAKALGLSDTVMEFELTPNRPDCLSIIGIAREAAAILKTPLKHPGIDLPPGNRPIKELTSVSIEAPDHCPRYVARVIQDIKIGPSPFWLQDRLHSVGLRSINNVVDVTNFVLMEMGQPLHAFDFDRLAEHRIVVKTAKEGERFTTLDGVERKLGREMLMICDGKGPVALAGIMGGLDSEIEERTQRVLIESACFNPVSIRRTAKRLGIGTESSYRFERGVDPDGTVRAADRAAQLMLEVGGGRLAKGSIDANPRPFSKRSIELSIARTNRLLGMKLGPEEVAASLLSIQIDSEKLDGGRLRVTPPSFRVDLERPEDLMEEVARRTGYDRIPTTHPVTEVIARPQAKLIRMRQQARQILVGCGFSEIVTYSFIGEDGCDKLLLSEDDPRRRVVPIMNPLTEDQRVMRSSLLPGLMATMYRNTTQRNEDLRIFELGKVFRAVDGEELPREEEMVAALWTGFRQVKTWHATGDPVDFYDIKGAAEALCGGLNVGMLRFLPIDGAAPMPYLIPSRSARVLAGDESEPIGNLGEVSAPVLERFELKQPVFCFDLDMGRLARLASEEKRARPIARYPATTRDLAIVVEHTVRAQEVLDFVAGMGVEHFHGVEIFDVYRGDRIPSGKLSLAIRITYQSFERSLTDAEVNRIQEELTHRVLAGFNAQIREA